MADLMADIRRGTEAMKVQAKAFEVFGKNISHVSDPHYSKQTITISGKGTYMGSYGPESLGVEVAQITSARSRILDSQVTNEIIIRGALEGQYSFSKNIESYFESDLRGLTDSADSNLSGGFGKSIELFFNAFHGLATTPSEASQRNFLLRQADTLVDKLHIFDSQMLEVDSNVVEQINEDVTAANLIMERIGFLNEVIAKFEVGGKQKALVDRDKRQAAIEELAQYVNFTVKDHPITTGSIQLVIKDTSNNDVILLDHNSLDNQFVFDGTNITNDAATPVTLDVTGGKIRGYMDVRTNTIAGTRTKLDNFARQLVTSVNLAYNPTTATGDFFDAANLTAATISLDPTLNEATLKASDTANSGANELADAVASLSGQKFATGSGDFIDGTYSQYYKGIYISIGQDVNRTQQMLESQNTMERALVERRDSQSRVSIDEEIADMLVYQKSYAAMARAVRVSSELLDILTREILR